MEETKQIVVGTIHGSTRNEAGEFIELLRDIISQGEKSGAFITVIEHKWWEHSWFKERGNETKYIKVGDWVYETYYTSHEAEDKEGLYYTRSFDIKPPVPVSLMRTRLEAQIRDIEDRFRGEKYFMDLRDRLKEFLSKL